MNRFRCYFFGKTGHIEASEEIEAIAVAQAIEQALARLAHHGRYRSIEVWDRDRMLYPAHEQPPPKMSG